MTLGSPDVAEPAGPEPAPSDDAVLLREFSPGDLAFIMSSWLRELRDADPGPLPDDIWFTAQRAFIERVLMDPSVRCRVAAAADQPGEILGWVVAVPEEVLLWVYVRKGLRRRGLAKMLLRAVNAPPGTPAAWSTVHSKLRLANPARGRQLRRRWPAPSPSPGRR